MGKKEKKRKFKEKYTLCSTLTSNMNSTTQSDSIKAQNLVFYAL